MKGRIPDISDLNGLHPGFITCVSADITMTHMAYISSLISEVRSDGLTQKNDVMHGLLETKSRVNLLFLYALLPVSVLTRTQRQRIGRQEK